MEQTGAKRTWNSVVAAVHVVSVFLILPLVYRDYYYDILQVKYYFYLGCVIVMAVLMLGYGLWMMQRGKAQEKQPQEKTQEQLCEKAQRKLWRQRLNVTDAAVLVFGIIATISTILSPFKYEAFWGNEGRYTGLFLLAIYVVAYFCITRCLNYRRLFLNILLLSGVLVAAFGITDFLDMDLLGFKTYISDQQYYIFTSTIGNINTYTALIAVYLGVSAVLFATAEKWWETAVYYICVCIFFFALITGISDNAYLSLAALFGFLPLYLFGSRKGFRRYVVLLATFFTVSQVIGIISVQYEGQVVEISGLFNLIAGYSKLYLVNIVLWGIALILCAVDLVKKRQNEVMKPLVRNLWLVLIGVVACAVLYVLYDVNIAGNVERYGSLKKYLVLDDEWGTHRGYIWRIAVENYMKLPLPQKIFGYGPDTFGLLTYFNNLKEMTARYGELFDSVHNEYLQYFVTIGPIGCGAYLVVLFSSIKSFVKKGRECPEVIAPLFGVLCYSAQAVVNINQPIAMPIMWTLLCVGLAKCRE